MRFNRSKFIVFKHFYIDILLLLTPKLSELSAGLYEELTLLISEGKICYAGLHSFDESVINKVKGISFFLFFCFFTQLQFNAITI